MRVSNWKKACLTFSILYFVLFISGCSLPGGKRREVPKIDMIVKNPLQVKRTDEFVVLQVSKLKEFAPDFYQNTFIVLQADSNQEVPYQLDDMNNDGEGDEIAMVMDMEPGEEKRVTIRYSPESPESRAVTLGYKKRTRSAVHPEFEGIGWESELAGYRISPDRPESVSIFGKQEKALSLDNLARNSSITSTKVVLDAGDSTGCGGFGLWHNNKFIKPGNDVRRYIRVAADGPVRSVVQVTFDKWGVDDQNLRVTATYSIFAGQRWSSNKVEINGANNPIKIASGLTKSKSAMPAKDEKNGIFYTWGTQSQLNPPDNLGMALIYSAENLDSFHEDNKSYFAVLNPGADNEITYWLLSAWNRGEIGIKQNTQFAELISSVAQNLKHPLTATIMPVKPK